MPRLAPPAPSSATPTTAAAAAAKMSAADAPIHWDAIVAGAGISGLAAARYLALNGRRVLIVESRNRTGGRIYTATFSPASDGASASSSSFKADLGASFVHGVLNNPLTKLSKEVPFQLHLPDPEVASMFPPRAHGVPEDAEWAEKVEYLNELVVFHRLARSSQEGQDSPGEDVSMMAALRQSKAGEGLYRGMGEEERKEVLAMTEMFSGYTGAKLDDVSVKWWGFEREFRGNDAVVQPGYSTLIDWYVKQVESHGGEIRLDHRVEAVENLDVEGSDYEGDYPVRVVVDTGSAAQTKLYAKYFISSLPLGVMQRSPPRFTPPLPPRRLDAIKRVGMGLLNKIILTYNAPWWHATAKRTDGQPADWIYLKADPEATAAKGHNGDSEALHLLASSPLFAQNYAIINGAPMLLFFAGPPLANALEVLDDATVGAIVHQRLVESAVSPSSPPPSAPSLIHVTRWASDSHSYGSYSYFPVARDGPGSGGSPLDMMELSNPLWDERLGFCGEHTEPNHFASVHGPLLTGIREGKRVHALLREREEGHSWDELGVDEETHGHESYRGLRV